MVYACLSHFLSSKYLAMNKLEKVALRSAPKRGRPLVLVINNIHYFQNDEAGRSMLLQLQQKAETWAASGELEYFISSSLALILVLIYIGILMLVFTT
jgi:hypothetical protein